MSSSVFKSLALGKSRTSGSIARKGGMSSHCFAAARLYVRVPERPYIDFFRCVSVCVVKYQSVVKQFLVKSLLMFIRFYVTNSWDPTLIHHCSTCGLSSPD